MEHTSVGTYYNMYLSCVKFFFKLFSLRIINGYLLILNNNEQLIDVCCTIIVFILHNEKLFFKT